MVWKTGIAKHTGFKLTNTEKQRQNNWKIGVVKGNDADPERAMCSSGLKGEKGGVPAQELWAKSGPSAIIYPWLRW